MNLKCIMPETNPKGLYDSLYMIFRKRQNYRQMEWVRQQLTWEWRSHLTIK